MTSWVAMPDIAEHQWPTVDFGVMKAAGIDYISIRAGISGHFDRYLTEGVLRATDAGISVVSLYWFVNPKAAMSAHDQGRLLADACQQWRVRKAMLDCEWYSSEFGPNPVITGQRYADWVRTMSDACTAEMGARPYIYTAASFWNIAPPTGGAGGADFSDHDLILATYPGWHTVGGRIVDNVPRGVPPSRWAQAAFGARPAGPVLPHGFSDYDGWQFSAGGNGQAPVYGCRGNDLDLNIVTDEAIARWLGIGPQPLPTPGPIPLDPEDTVVKILAPRGRNARFLANVDARGIAYTADWVATEAELAPFVNAGVPIMEVDVTDMKNVHVDRIPVGDGWADPDPETGQSPDFRRVG